MKIDFLAAAQSELDDAFEWYEAQQKNLGVQFIGELNAAIKRISAYPDSYILIDSLVGGAHRAHKTAATERFFTTIYYCFLPVAYWLSFSGMVVVRDAHPTRLLGFYERCLIA